MKSKKLVKKTKVTKKTTKKVTKKLPSCEIICVVDRSGSMESKKDEAIGGFNTFLKAQQQLPGEAYMTLVLFDHEYLTPFTARPLVDVPPLDSTTYEPRGMTALLDAIGRTIKEADGHPPADKTIVCIITDGFENASQNFNQAQVKEMVTEMTTRGWEFIFMGANIDRFNISQQYGISLGNTTSYNPAAHQGTQNAYLAMSVNTSTIRSNQ